jgi:outer membrane receptor protein involved in Fe transport
MHRLRCFARVAISSRAQLLGGLTLVLFLVTMAIAQTSRGTLTGTVTDTSGAVVTKATVKITETNTNVSRQTTTNGAGIYRFDAVDLGTYTVTVGAQGFATEDRTGVEIQAAHTLNLDFALKVGAATEVVTVEASGIQIALQTSEQVRGENFSAQTIATLPVVGGDSLTLTQLLPGVALGSTNSINQDGTMNFAVNGQRPRGNNFLIDGVENNDISVTGPAFTISNPDAIQEVNIQTADFSAEYGRAGGAVFNQITKSGTNDYHGSVAWVYTGSAFKALNHLQRVGGFTDAPRVVENIPDFTIGGPVLLPGYNGHNKTFFFAAAQWDRLYGNATRATNVVAPDDAGVALLQSLAGSCPNAALYLKAIGSVRGNPALSVPQIPLAVPSGPTCNGTLRTGLNLTAGQVTRRSPQAALDNNHQVRVDHNASDKQTLSFRWLYDSNTTTPSGLANFPGFDSDFTGKTLTGAFVDTYAINPRMTNEFRFNYGRIGFNFPLHDASDPFLGTLANYSPGSGLTAFGGATNIPQFRYANNWQYQDTLNVVRGKHTFRFGGDFLRQLARQHPPFNERGSFGYASSVNNLANPLGITASAFANFLDDFGGRTGSLNRQFGSSIYHPNLFRQSYFFQDSWKATGNLTLNLGVRYEVFGQPANTFTVAGFTNYDPVNFAAPHKLDTNFKNIGPSVGFAWNPKGDHWFQRMLGGEKMVWRAGYQRSFDASFNNLLSNIAGSSPNTLGGNIGSSNIGRGAAGFSSLFSGIAATPPDKTSAQSNLLLGNIPNPDTQRWSLGFQRELPYNLIMDTSYVGSVSHHLYQTLDMNPIVNLATGDRLHPELQTSSVPAIRSGQGIRTVRAASANSNYESLQFNLRRSLKSTPIGSVQLVGSYTYAHYLDNISDVFGFDSTPSSFQSAPQVLGFSPRIDYGNSDFDRRHVGAISVLWTPRAPTKGLMGSLVGGWTLSAVSHWSTGFPFTVANGFDRNGDGQTVPDRPDISNAAAPLNTRAALAPTAPVKLGDPAGKGWCPTGFSNPDAAAVLPLTLVCIDPNTVHFVESSGPPNARTVGRNTLFAPGLDNVDFSIAKRFRFTEKSGFELRLDMFNALNTTNLGNQVAGRAIDPGAPGVLATPPGFLDFNQTDSFGRSMRVRAKFEF